MVICVLVFGCIWYYYGQCSILMVNVAFFECVMCRWCAVAGRVPIRNFRIYCLLLPYYVLRPTPGITGYSGRELFPYFIESPPRNQNRTKSRSGKEFSHFPLSNPRP